MITIEVCKGLFYGNKTVKRYLKDGTLFALSVDGKIKRRYKSPSWPCELSRAQGFRYWKRYFSNRTLLELPIELRQAIEKG